jgi:uncharacterized OB-fold protein
MTTRSPQVIGSPLPAADEHSAPYWQALERGELTLPKCEVCGALNHPIDRICRVCESGQLSWSRVEPRGRLYSWAIEHRPVIPGFDPPYVIAQVTPAGCAEGEVRVSCTLLVDDPAALAIGMPVVLATATAPGAKTMLAHFVPE